MAANLSQNIIPISGEAYLRALRAGDGIKFFGATSGFAGWKPKAIAGSLALELPDVAPVSNGLIPSWNTDGTFAGWTTGGGTAGGANQQVQFNNAGAFGGITGSTWNGTTLTLPQTVINGRAAFGPGSSLTGHLYYADPVTPTVAVYRVATDPTIRHFNSHEVLELDFTAPSSVVHNGTYIQITSKAGNAHSLNDTVGGFQVDVQHKSNGTMTYGVATGFNVWADAGKQMDRTSAIRTFAAGGTTNRSADIRSVRSSSYGILANGENTGLSLDVTTTLATTGTDLTYGIKSQVVRTGAISGEVVVRNFYSVIQTDNPAGANVVPVDFFADKHINTSDFGAFFWGDSDGVTLIKNNGEFYQYNPGFATKFTNTAVNFEGFKVAWNANVAEFGTIAGGTGVLRQNKIIGNGTKIAGHVAIKDADIDTDPFVLGLSWKAALNVKDTITTVSGANSYWIGISNYLRVNPSSSMSDKYAYGLYSYVESASGNSQPINYFVSATEQIAVYSTGLVSTLIGRELSSYADAVANVTDNYGISLSTSGGVNARGVQSSVNVGAAYANGTTSGIVTNYRAVTSNTKVVTTGTDTTIGFESVMFRTGAGAGASVNVYGFSSTITVDSGVDLVIDYYVPARIGSAANSYAFWLQANQVTVIETDGEFKQYNPLATTYVAGAADSEYGIHSWDGANVYVMGAAKTGTGTLRTTKVVGNAITLDATTTILSKCTVGTGSVTGVPTVQQFTTSYDSAISVGSVLANLARINQTVANAGTIQAFEAYGRAQHSTGTVFSVVASVCSSDLNGAGDITNLRGLQASCGIQSSGTGTVTNATPIYVPDGFDLGTGSITNLYGVYIEQQTKGTSINYGLYLNGSGNNAFVGGHVTVTDEAYNAGSWDGNFTVPTKNAVRDKIESLILGSGTGDVVGPASATDNAVARFDTTTGKLIQNSVVLVSDTGAITGATTFNKITFTEPATAATLTIANNKTFTVNNTLTLTATDGSTLAIGAGGTLGSAAYTSSGDYATAGHTHTSAGITDFAEAVDDRVSALLVAGTGISLSYNDPANTLTITNTVSGVSDGDKGDIVVSGSGATWLFDSAVVTADAKTVLDDASVADMVNTLGGAASTGSGGLVRTTSPTLVTPTLGVATATSITLNNAGLLIYDTNTSHTLNIVPGSDLTANRVFTLTTGDVNRTLNISAANVTISSDAATVLDDATVADMVNTLGGAASTGSGGLVRTNSAALIAPSLDTPTSGTLTNCIGLPISSGVSGLGTNVATFLGSPTSANLAGCVTDETGTGALVFANGPEFAGRLKTIAVYQPWIDDTDGATITFDLALGNLRRVTLAGNRTLALSNATVGGQAFVIRLQQDATGTRTVTWFAGISWVGGTTPVLTTTANKADAFGFIRTGSNTYDGYIVGQNI